MDHQTFISHLASIYKPKVYVELGINFGACILKVIPHAQKVYGIDFVKRKETDEIRDKYSNVEIIYCTTDKFFEDYKGPIDMAFIDADHCVASATKDFYNVVERLTPGGLILLHDTDPISDDLISTQNLWCGDSYKIVKTLEDHPDFNILTIPLTEAGLSIVQKKNNTRTALRHSK